MKNHNALNVALFFWCVVGLIIYFAIGGSFGSELPKAKYYITDQKRETKQFFVAEDWPIVKEWDIDLIWVDSNAPIIGVESKGRCGVIRFKTTEFIDKENFSDCEYISRKDYPDCGHFYWTLNQQLEKK